MSCRSHRRGGVFPPKRPVHGTRRLLTHILVSLSLFAGDVHPECTATNRYGTQPGGCDALIASGEYSCAGSFARGERYAGLCDLACGFCTARSRTRRLQDSSACAARARVIADAAEAAVAEMPFIIWHSHAESARDTAIAAVTADMRLDFERMETRAEVAASGQQIDTYACKLWEGLTADQHGGAIMMSNSAQLSVTGSAFVGNRAQSNGGAIYLSGFSQLAVSGCVFVGNIASGLEGASGGALWTEEDAQLTVSASTFIANNGQVGGAIGVRDRSQLGVWTSTFIGNTAGLGGAIYVSTGRLTASDALFMLNSAFGGQGGAMYSSDGTFILSGTTFLRNCVNPQCSTLHFDSGDLDLVNSTFRDNNGDGKSQVVAFAEFARGSMGTMRFYVYNTTFSPFRLNEAETGSVAVNVLGGCEQYPCPEGFGCRYENYSLACTPCPGTLISRDGIRCELPFICAPGTQCTTDSRCNDQSQCVPCSNGTVSDGSGECVPCNRAGERANDALTACVPCAAGTEPSLDHSQCISCSTGKISEGVSCEPCAVNGTTPTSVPNEGRTACVPCTAGTVPSSDGDTCVCDSNHYNTTSTAVISCYEDVFEEVSSAGATRSGCARCGTCIDCKGPPIVQPQYVRLNFSMLSSANDRALSATYDGQVQQAVDTTIPVFRCKSVSGCFGRDSTDPTVSGCQQNYTGFLCESCAPGYERVDGDSDRGCQACSPSATMTWAVVVAIAAFGAVVAKIRHRLARAIAPNAALVANVLAVGRSAWQPIRIVVSYAQVTSQVGASLNVQYPPAFTSIANQLADLLDVVDGVLGIECLGLNGFHTQWVTQVVAFPLGLAAVALGIFAVERLRSSRDTARKHLAGNIFFVTFLCYPRVCQTSFNAWICRRVLSDLSVLVADDRVACESSVHVTFQWLSLLVLIVIALGVPVATMIILYRERKAQPAVNKSLKLRTAEALAITPEQAEFAVNDIRLGSSYGFLVDAFRPKYFYWESMDMLRKLALLGLVLLFERGSVNQIAVSLVISFFFMAAHLQAQPYKLAADNYFRTATELHVFLTIATGLIFRTDLDNPFANQLAAHGSNGDPEYQRLYDLEAKARRSSYDSMLVVTFFFFVAVATVATVVAKMVLVARAMASRTDQDSAVEGKQDTLMRAAYTRFRLGLATGSDHMDLVDFIDQLDVNQHVRAGKRLWREKHLVSHFTAGQMSAMLRDIEQQLPKSEAIAYHFTDLDAARVILDQSQGLRASTVGQLGGGVSVCLASPTVLGWDKHGGESMTFCQRVGDELWGSKAHEVLPGVPPAGAHADYGKFHNKLEVLLLVRIPAAQNRDNSRIVPGRDNVYIIDNRDCEPGIGTDTARYYSNLNIERCLVLKSPATEADRNKLDTFASRPRGARVKVQSSRNNYNGMAEVMVKEVQSTERIDDDLTQLGNWCPAVTTFTAIAACPPDGVSTVRQFHQALYQRRHNHVLWPENIARFTFDEMAAALHSIEQSVPHCYTLAFHYTSAANANRMCKDGKGIDGNETGGVVTASLHSPVEFGWQKNSGGSFKETAGTAVWGAQWRHSHPDKIQALLVMGMPTEELPDNPGTTFPIPEPLLATDETGGAKCYPNAHVYKSYLLDPDAAIKKPVARDTDSDENETLTQLFERVDVDGDGEITQEEAMQYIRKQGIDLDENAVAMIFEGADSNGDGTIDVSEFPRLMDAVSRVATKTATSHLPTHTTPVHQEAAPDQSHVGQQQQGTKEGSQAAVLFERVDIDGSGLISFDEFVDWWAHRQLSTGHTLDEGLAARMQEKWNELDRDGSGDLDKNEFESLMAELATSQWKEAFDPNKQKVYYYNTRTKETRWRQPDAEAAVADFMATNGLTTLQHPSALATTSPTELKRPPPLSTLRPARQEGNATPAATATIINPLSTSASPSSRVDAFDVEVPALSPLDVPQQHSGRSMAQARVANRVVRRPATAVHAAGATGRALPRRPTPRRPPPRAPRANPKLTTADQQPHTHDTV